MRLIKLDTISDYHSFMGLPRPKHPLVSVIRFEHIKRSPKGYVDSLVNNFYSIALKQTFNARMKYGQQEYDFKDGVLAFIAPKQVISVVYEKPAQIQHTGWLLLVHPDFLWNTTLVETIKKYDFFDYKLSEALHLSEREEAMLCTIIENIDGEYNANIDRFSQDVIIAQLELLLKYAERFYERQFITRKKDNHTILGRLENILGQAFAPEALQTNGIPTVQQIAEALNLSPNYLTSVLKVLTGQSTQQLIHDRLISRAKEELSTTELSISEISYRLGFEHPQSFAKLFKTKTELSPSGFRNSFN